MQSFKAWFQEVEIPSLVNWKPSDFKYIPTVKFVGRRHIRICTSDGGKKEMLRPVLIF